MAAPVILVEAAPRRAADGVPVTVRLAGGGAAVAYHYGGEHWRAGLTGLPKSTASLDFDGEQLGGGGVAQSIELGWAPASSAALSELSDLYWTDAPITVRVGPEGAALPAIVSQGLVLEAPVDRGTLRIALADQTADLNRALLTDHYAGTGGIEGPIEFEGLIKSRAWGRCFNVPGRQIDAATNIWVFGDPRRAWSSFDQVRDKGVAADAGTISVLGWQGSAEATFAALKVTPATEGGGVLCPSIACVKWWTQPAGDLHADIRGETDGGYVETAPEIAQRIVAARSTLTFAAGAVAAAAEARPAPFGWRVDSDSSTAASEISTMLGGVSLSWLLVDGAIVFRPWDWTAPVRVGRSFAVTRRSTTKPIGSRKLGYRRNWSPMARGDLAAIVLSLDVVYEDGTPIENLKPATPGATAGGTIGTDIKAPDGEILDPAEILNSALTFRPDGSLYATIGGVPTLLGKATLPDLGAASDAARRQLEADLARLSGAVAQLAAGQSIVQTVFRDAGLYTDSSGGIAKLFAIERRAEQITNLSVTLNAALGTIGLKADVNYVNQAILQAQLGGASADLSSILVRLTSAEATIGGLQATVQLKADATVVTGLQGLVSSVASTLDALAGVVATKASQTIVDAQGQRLTLAEQTLSAFDGAAITQTVTASRRAPADSDAAGGDAILNMLNSAQSANTAQTGIAQARTELGARVTSAFDAIASLSVTLGVQIGATNALIGQATTAQIAGDQALASQIASYQVSTNSALASVNQALVAQTTTNGSLAGSIQTLSTTVGGHTSTLTLYGQSLDGLSAKWGAEFNQDGVISGFALNSGAGRTDAAFLVTSFKIAVPGGSAPRSVFSVATDGVVEMPNVRVVNLRASTVNADTIVGGAVSRTVIQITPAPIVIGVS